MRDRILTQKAPISEPLVLGIGVASRAFIRQLTYTGRPKNFAFDWPTEAIRYVVIRGNKRSNYFGFAFDNFKTGVDPCPPRPTGVLD